MRRLITYLLAAIALGLAFSLLYSSWSQPPPQTTLDLAQTNLSLQAVRTLDNPDYQDVARALLGSEDPLTSATQRYQDAASTLTRRMAPLQAQLEAENLAEQLQLQQKSLDELSLRAGLLLAQQDELLKAQDYWQGVKTEELVPVAEALSGLWGTQFLRIVPNAEVLLQKNLDGWFEFVALQQLYRLQQRSNVLQVLEQEQEQVAVDSLNRLVLLSGVPLVGVFVGIVLLIVWGVGAALKKWPAFGPQWSVPWDIDTMVAVVSIWFIAYLLVGLFVPGVYVSFLGAAPRELGYVQQAIALAITYAVGAAIGLFLIAVTVRTYQEWSKPALDATAQKSEVSVDLASTAGSALQVHLLGKWPLWGVSGYLAALPMVVLAGALAQKLLPQSGGGNPILPIILNSQGWLPGAIFLLVVSVMAPIFEETLFRGFVLPSLTKVMPVWGAILLTAVLFAIVHLNVSDLLPLTVLGIVLGTVYSRSRNLLAPMLLHSCWNAGSFAALTILSGGL
ncbi:MAG: lysostaphin resistance A-like protein [Synechococcus sp.]